VHIRIKSGNISYSSAAAEASGRLVLSSFGYQALSFDFADHTNSITFVLEAHCSESSIVAHFNSTHLDLALWCCWILAPSSIHLTTLSSTSLLEHCRRLGRPEKVKRCHSYHCECQRTVSTVLLASNSLSLSSHLHLTTCLEVRTRP
jgi:hypothetical protein